MEWVFFGGDKGEDSILNVEYDGPEVTIRTLGLYLVQS